MTNSSLGCDEPLPAPRELQLRKAAGADGRLLHRACYPDDRWADFCQRFEQLLKWQTEGRCIFLIAESEGGAGVAGCGVLMLTGGQAEIANLVVARGYRGKGIGSTIIGSLTEEAKLLQLPSLEIAVDASNTRAWALYRRLGFHEDRRLNVPGKGEAIILRRALS